jgi:lipase
VLDDYCRHALAAAGEGDGWKLACAPETEAAVYATARAAEANPWPHLSKIQAPVWVVRSGRADAHSAFSRSPTAPNLAAHLRRGHDSVAPALSHFLPMESPPFCADLVKRVLADLRNGA